MNEYINRETALRILMRDFLEKAWDGCASEEYRIARTVIAEIPAEAVAPVQASYWIKHWHDTDMIGHQYEECEHCGCIINDTEKFWDAKFCPNCGSKMI